MNLRNTLGYRRGLEKGCVLIEDKIKGCAVTYLIQTLIMSLTEQAIPKGRRVGIEAALRMRGYHQDPGSDGGTRGDYNSSVTYAYL